MLPDGFSSKRLEFQATDHGYFFPLSLINLDTDGCMAYEWPFHRPYFEMSHKLYLSNVGAFQCWQMRTIKPEVIVSALGIGA